MTPISDFRRPPTHKPAPVFTCASTAAAYNQRSKSRNLSSPAKLGAERSRGFTLLEILLVLTIIGMASVLVVPNLTGIESRTFNVQLRQANSLLNYARRIAVVSGRVSTVSLYASGEQDDESEQADETPAALANIVGEWEATGIELRFRDSTDREVEVEERIDISFYPEGGSSGGTLLFTEDERQALIVIDPFTGRINSMEEES